jgi:hypothetical protein
LAVAAVLAAAPAAFAETVTFGPNSAAQPFHRWTVPARVCSATFDLYGAEGSGGVGGARVTTTLAVEPGTPYDVYVGSWGVVGRGGYNGGGDASGNGVGGGGATDVRTGAGLAERILVAGGGGGNGGRQHGGPGGLGGGGGLVGADGTEDTSAYYEGYGGSGGSATSGGAFGHGTIITGNPPPGAGDGAPGTLGIGGAGGVIPDAGAGGYGGGGGGGLYGGGGGGAGHPGGGGGGGSSLAAGGTVTPTSGGQGKAIITYFASASCSQAGGQPGGGQPGGGQPGGGTDRSKPRLRALALARHSFAAARSGPSISPDTKSTPRTGTKVSIRVSETSRVRFRVERKVTGRRLRGRCVRPGEFPGGKRCTRWAAVSGSFSVSAYAGKNTFVFRGRVGGRSLGAGDYRLSVKATDNARNTSSLKRAGFTIVR